MGKLRVLNNEAPGHIQCPSARPEMPGSVAFGVVLGTVEQPRVAFLDQTVPVTEELLALARPVSPTEVFRFAAPCAGKACQHFDGASCRLATRIVQHLPEEPAPLPEVRHPVRLSLVAAGRGGSLPALSAGRD